MARKTAANLECSEVILQVQQPLWGQQALSFEKDRCQFAAKLSVPLKHDVHLKSIHSDMSHSVAITNAAEKRLVWWNETSHETHCVGRTQVFVL
jgi:hypothetical protein